MSRPFLMLGVLVLGAACAPKPTFEDVNGLWGRVSNGRHQVWELAETIDATGIEDVVPAFRRWEYALDTPPREVARGRWNVFDRDLVVTPAWANIAEDDPDATIQLTENRTVILPIDDFTPVELLLVYPDEDEPRTYVKLQELPEAGVE